MSINAAAGEDGVLSPARLSFYQSVDELQETLYDVVDQYIMRTETGVADRLAIATVAVQELGAMLADAPKYDTEEEEDYYAEEAQACRD